MASRKDAIVALFDKRASFTYAEYEQFVKLCLSLAHARYTHEFRDRGTSETADDLSQEIVIRMLQKINDRPDIVTGEHFFNWFMRLVNNDRHDAREDMSHAEYKYAPLQTTHDKDVVSALPEYSISVKDNEDAYPVLNHAGFYAYDEIRLTGVLPSSELSCLQKEIVAAVEDHQRNFRAGHRYRNKGRRPEGIVEKWTADSIADDIRAKQLATMRDDALRTLRQRRATTGEPVTPDAIRAELRRRYKAMQSVNANTVQKALNGLATVTCQKLKKASETAAAHRAQWQAWEAKARAWRGVVLPGSRPVQRTVDGEEWIYPDAGYTGSKMPRQVVEQTPETTPAPAAKDTRDRGTPYRALWPERLRGCDGIGCYGCAIAKHGDRFDRAQWKVNVRRELRRKPKTRDDSMFLVRPGVEERRLAA